MLSRRKFLMFAGALAGVALPAAALAQSKPLANDPTALLTKLYTQAAKDNAGGHFVNDPKERARYLSKAFAALWSKAEAKAPEGDVGPIDFDPVSNSQDPDIKSFAIKVEAQDAGTATLAVTLTGSQPRKFAADSVLRYDFVRDGAHWRIDDIRGAVDGEAWSVRELLTSSLKR
jgi:hypothetical protein